MKKKQFFEIMDNILNEGQIEGHKIDNIDIIKFVLNDSDIRENLYNQFNIDYENVYGDDNSFHYTKIQDMMYQIHLLINYNFIDKYSLYDKDKIKDAVKNIVSNNELDLYDAVSYDNSDLEIVENNECVVRDALQTISI